ncbi:MAG TPA: LolA-related protein [Rhodanobacteraceae bacterium]
MTSGRSSRAATLSLLIATLLSPVAASADSANADAIVASLKRDAPARTAFSEVRFSSVLERPLILRGELEYSGPDKLARTVKSPYEERMTVENGQASVQRGEKPARAFSLSQAPELEGFLRGFAALLGGDAAALARDFTLVATGNANAWHLKLTPRDERLARRVTALEVDGSGNSARCFHTIEADGDVNVLLVESLADAKLPNRPTPPMIDALCRGLASP